MKVPCTSKERSGNTVTAIEMEFYSEEAANADRRLGIPKTVLLT